MTYLLKILRLLRSALDFNTQTLKIMLKVPKDKFLYSYIPLSCVLLFINLIMLCSK